MILLFLIVLLRGLHFNSSPHNSDNAFSSPNVGYESKNLLSACANAENFLMLETEKSFVYIQLIIFLSPLELFLRRVFMNKTKGTRN